MRKSAHFAMIVMVCAWAVMTLWGCADSEPRKSLDIERSETMTLRATVEAVDLDNRIVTLKAPTGKSFRLHAGKEVVNLHQVKPGDEVVAVYAEALAVRLARPGEVRDEFAQEVGRARPGSKPGAYGIAETTVTARIEEMDKTRQTARLRMPDGDQLTVRVKDPANLEKVRVGDTIVITYQEALAVSLEKAKK